MCGDVFINEAANHLLIFQAMFVSLGFEKIHTTFRQSQGNFYGFLFENQLIRWRQKVFNYPCRVNIDIRRLIGIFDAFFHKAFFLSANSRHPKCEFFALDKQI